MSQIFSIGWLQLNSNDKPKENLSALLSGLKYFEASSVSLVVTPENILYQRVNSEPAAFALQGAEDPILNSLKQWTVAHGTALLLGGVRTQSEGDRCKNSIWWLDPKGMAHQVYSKIHLFNVDVAGEPRVRESDIFAPGDGASVVEFQNIKFGMSICYDLRFPEMYQSLGSAGAQVLLVPSAFLPKTGRDHWLTLLRARAIENQCFVVAPAQGGRLVNEAGDLRQTWGQSVVIDPWGAVMAQMPSLDEMKEGDSSSGPLAGRVSLDLELIQKVRRQMPVRDHKKPSAFFEAVQIHSL